MTGRIVILTGAPGTGKSTVGELVAAQSDLPRSVHLLTDDFYHYLKKGYVAPNLPAANDQNKAVINAIVAAATAFAAQGYEVIVDGIIGPCFLQPWRDVSAEYEVHYLVLRASEEITRQRAISRAKLDRATNLELVATMWHQFAALGSYEANVIDTNHGVLTRTVAEVRRRISTGENRLH